MAEKTLTVRLLAQIGQYQQAMGKAAKSTDQITAAGARVQQVGRSISGVGDTLTKSVTLPLGLVGAAAIKMASDFDASFVKMQTLAGVSAGEVDGLKESVLDLAGETGRAPQELADALYFLQSSGLSSSQAMDALEVSAKGAAAGLGSTVQVADAVSSAMLAYAKSGLTAAEATDVLVETARQGKVEPAELASQMARLVPIASELGITFGDVGGAIAVLSQRGANAEQATTLLTNVMNKLLKPSQQGAKLLAEVGLSTDKIRESIADKGLLATLELLKAQLGDAGFIKFLEDQQAVQGGLAILGGDLEKTRGIFEAVGDSAGATENAFSKWAESMGAQNAKAFANFQVALIQVGEVLAPIASDILSFVADIAKAFSNLPGPVRNGILAFAGFAAALGPIFSVGGRLVTVYGTLARVLSNLAVPAGSVAGAFGNATTATGGFSKALGSLAKVGLVTGGLIALREVVMLLDDDLKGIDVSTLENELLDLAETGKFSGEQLKTVFEGIGDVFEGGADPQKMEAFVERLGEVDKALAQLAGRDPAAAAQAFREITAAMQEGGLSSEQARQFFDNYTAAVAEADTASRTGAGGVEELGGALGEEAALTEEATSALQGYVDQLTAMTDPIFAAMDAITGNRDAQLAYRDAAVAVMEAQGALNEALAGGDPTAIAEATRGLEDAQRGLSDAQWATVESAAGVDSALAGLTDAVANGNVSMATFKDTLATWVAQGYLTQGQADAAAASVGALAGEAAAADEERVDIPVDTPGAPKSRTQLREVRDAALNVPKRTDTHVAANDRASGIIAYVRSNLARLDGQSATVTIYHNTIFTETLRRFGADLNKRQHGGPVMAGHAYLVGEERPEVFVPYHDGTILPSVSTLGHMNGGGGGGGGSAVVNNHFSFPNYVGNRNELVAELNKAMDRGARVGAHGKRL